MIGRVVALAASMAASLGCYDPDLASPDGGNPATDGRPLGDAEPTEDAPPGPIEDGAPPADATSTDAADAGAGRVDCGAMACLSPAYCCYSSDSSPLCDPISCKGHSLYCDGPEDCPGGDACCLIDAVIWSGCVTAADCVGNGVHPMCHDSNDCDGVGCTPHPGMPAFLVCQ